MVMFSANVWILASLSFINGFVGSEDNLVAVSVTLVVELKSSFATRRVRLIFDSGSQRSYISKHVAIEMKYDPVGQEKLVHSLFGGFKSSEVIHDCFKVHLKNLENDYECRIDVLDQAIICKNVSFITDGPWMIELSNLGITIHDIKDDPIEILVGADVMGKLLTGKRYDLQCGLVALETKLGWTLMGKVTSKVNSSLVSIVSSMHCISGSLANLWELDAIGISDPAEMITKRQHEEEIMRSFKENVKILGDGRYEVSLPWIEDHLPLPSNFSIAKKRLDRLMEKLDKDGLYDEYDAVLKDWCHEKIIEEVPADEISKAHVHYLPHRHVVKLSSSTTKLRPVFDASARVGNCPSLNQCLEKGINLLEHIPSMLLQFRINNIGVISDIKKAFLQISLRNRDRDYLRFLWFDKERNLKYFRHLRVVFGVTSSPFLLNAVINHHLNKYLFENECSKSKYSKNTIQRLQKGFYVDNCVTSVSDKDELHTFIKEATDVMAEAQFELRLWEHTNDKNSDKSRSSSVLGMLWNRTDDSLFINIEEIEGFQAEKITKRIILSVANSIFDPIGYASPVLLLPKILLRDTWLLKLSWNEEVPNEMKQEFLKWCSELTLLSNIQIPRWLGKGSFFVKWSIHLFCDASKDAYAAVVYSRLESLSGVTIQLIQSKSRIAPIKMMSIPRLELLAATIGARLLSSIMRNLKDYSVDYFCWTDSSTVLSWIKREDIWKPFVWNRVKEIRNLTRKENWHYIPGNLNPADLPSRGCTTKHLILSKWWEGFDWLKKDQTDWPDQNCEVHEIEVMEEKRKNSTSMLGTMDYQWFNRFSCYNSLIRMFGWIRRFIFNAKAEKTMRRKDSFLSASELDEAEDLLIRVMQRESFGGIDDESLSSLCPFLDDVGVMRIKTKITEREDSYTFRYPAILPNTHPVTFRLIEFYHIKNHHMGTQGLLCLLRERFWLLKGRKTIRSVIKNCVRCRRYDSVHKISPTVCLPKDRVRDADIFEIIGVDMAGPLFVRGKVKVWICIFTCDVYRAVHLELLNSLTTEAFLQGLRRFIARRGRPLVVYSDNGSSFIGADNILKNLDWEKVSEFSGVEKITWKFNPPSAAWWGGWWERLIRLLKQLLRKTLGKTSLNLEELSTILCECESVMNGRPITYVSEIASDLSPLTPSMFLSGVKETGTPELNVADSSSLNRRLRYKQKLSIDLRKRFRSEYLGQLVLRRRNVTDSDIQKGEIVLIENDNTKRMDWLLGLVEEIFPGKDGKVRVVKLKTTTGSVLRPVQKLYPLEIRSKDEVSEFNCKISKREKKNCGNENISGDEERRTRSGRKIKKPDRFNC